MRDVDKNAFGQRVAEKRQQLGLSQPDLARMVGMRQQGIASIESGVVERPRLLRELASALRTTEEWLLWGEGDRDDPRAGSDDGYSRVELVGLVGAGGEVNSDINLQYGEEIVEVEVPYIVKHGAKAFEVWGESMLPKYDPGDIIVVRQGHSPEEVLGDIALIVTEDGRRYVKRVLKGSLPGHYNLESFNARPMPDIPLREVGRVLMVLPKKEVRIVGEKEIQRRTGRKKKPPEAAE